MRHVIAACCLVAMCASTASAAIRTWTGLASGSWMLAANWGGTAPVAGDDLVFPGGALNLSNSNDFPIGTTFNSITITGAGYTLSGSGLIIGPGGISSSTGTATININMILGAAQTWSVTGGTLTSNGSMGFGGLTLTLSASAGASGALNGAVGNTAHFLKIGAGDWTLGGANSFDGQVVINAGRLIAANATALGTADDTLPNGTIVNVGGSLRLQGFAYPAERLTVDGTGEGGGGVLQVQTASVASFNGTVELGATTAMVMDLTAAIRFNGILTGAGRLGLGGPGVFVLGNSGNNFSGGVLWGATGTTNSVLQLGVSGAVPNSVAINVGAGGEFNLNGLVDTVLSIAGPGNVDLDGGALTVTGGSGTLSGVLSGQPAADFSNTGQTLTLTSVNTYAGTFNNAGGTTTVVGGALPGPFLQPSGLAEVSSNGTLGFATFTGGTFRPGGLGSGIGNTSSLVFSNSTYAQVINTPTPGFFGQINVTGTITLGAATALNLIGLGTVSNGDSFTMLNNDGVDAVIGTFAGLPNGSVIVAGPGGFNYSIVYNGGTGNDVVLTAIAAEVPSVGSVMLLALAIALATMMALSLRGRRALAS